MPATEGWRAVVFTTKASTGRWIVSMMGGEVVDEPMVPTTSNSTDPKGSTVALPLLNAGRPPKSRMGRRRAIVLSVVQVLIIVHIVLWLLGREYGWFGGATITPIEPSEGMEFGKNGVINAGLIFFALALLSTLILGRWFCGWGCHIVLLQDLCLWILRRFNIRPHPFRSRLLLWAPLVLAVYMFIWPAFYRLVLAPFVQPDLAWPGLSMHLTTHDFWATFPGLSVAIIFLLICGFATVYFLGGKGFCTYGCPYGGFFAPLDRFAPGSIRVTDDCRQCGECTAGCTSNVRVHDEVRTWGMVTDPGCMKTMDCVNNCPNNALYFGFGASAATTTKSRPRSEPVLRKWDLSVGEEWAFALVCLLIFLAFRGAYASVPLLMAIGIASIVTFLSWKAWRVLRDENVHLHRWRLKFHGQLRLPGVTFVAITVLLLLFTIQTGMVNWIGWGATRVSRDVFTSTLQSGTAGGTLDEATHARAASALGWFDLVSSMGQGGMGIATDPNHDLEAARLLLLLGEPEAASLRLEPVVASFPDDLGVRRFQLQLVMIRREPAQVEEHVELVTASPAVRNRLQLDVAEWHLGSGRSAAAESMVRSMLQEDESSLGAMKLLAVVLVNTGRVDDGLVQIRRYLEAAPGDAHAWVTLAQVLAGQDDLAAADTAMETALNIAGEDPSVLVESVRFYAATGRPLRARELEARLRRLLGQ